MQSPIEFFVEINRDNLHFVGARRRYGRHDAEKVQKYVVSPAADSESWVKEPDNGRTGLSKQDFDQWIESLQSSGNGVEGPFDLEVT